MKLSTRDKNIIVFFLIAIIILCAYTFGYKKLNEKNEVLESDIVILNNEYNQKTTALQEKHNFLLKTKQYNERFDEILAKYPNGLAQENQIMFAVELEEKFKYDILSLSMSEYDTFFEFAESNAASGNNLEAISSVISLPFEVTYDVFKEILLFLQHYPEKTVMTAVEASYSVIDEERSKQLGMTYVEGVTGLVASNITFVQYAITGNNRILVQPDIKDIKIGTPNIFLDKKQLGSTLPTLNDHSTIVRAVASRDMYVKLSKTNALATVKGTQDSRTTKSTTQSFNQSLYINFEKDVDTGLYAIYYSFSELTKDQAGAYTGTYIKEIIQPGDHLDLLVESCKREIDELPVRPGEELNATPTEYEKNRVPSTVSFFVENNTEMPLNIVVINDDTENPRYVAGSTDKGTGEVKIFIENEYTPYDKSLNPATK